MKLYLVISGLAPDAISEYGYFCNRENAEKKLKEITPHFSNVIEFRGATGQLEGFTKREPESIYDYDPRIVELETAD